MLLALTSVVVFVKQFRQKFNYKFNMDQFQVGVFSTKIVYVNDLHFLKLRYFDQSGHTEHMKIHFKQSLFLGGKR
jgi:hypothetical protein